MSKNRRKSRGLSSFASGANQKPGTKSSKSLRQVGGKTKYGARKTVVDGIKFDSMAEARRYSYLKILESAGDITDLELQPEFELAPALYLDGKIQRRRVYRADFAYLDRIGQWVVEDVKGFATPMYRLKRHLVRHLYGVEVVEV